VARWVLLALAAAVPAAGAAHARVLCLDHLEPGLGLAADIAAAAVRHPEAAGLAAAAMHVLGALVPRLPAASASLAAALSRTGTLCERVLLPALTAPATLAAVAAMQHADGPTVAAPCAVGAPQANLLAFAPSSAAAAAAAQRSGHADLLLAWVRGLGAAAAVHKGLVGVLRAAAGLLVRQLLAALAVGDEVRVCVASVSCLCLTCLAVRRGRRVCAVPRAHGEPPALCGADAGAPAGRAARDRTLCRGARRTLAWGS
jgi:hypothetical protein